MHLRESIDIHADPDLVWRHLADFANDPTWRSAVSVMAPEPPGPAHEGQRVHEVLTFRGSTYVTDTCVTDVQPRRVAFEGSGDETEVRGERTMTERDGTVEVTLSLTIRLRGVKRPLELVMGPMYHRLVREDLGRLRQLLERVQVG